MAQDHRIEPLAREVAVVLGFTVEWSVLGGLTKSDCRRLAAFIIAREEKRVGPLVDAVDAYIDRSTDGYAFHDLRAARAAYRALDAEPEPTLAEAVEAVEAMLAARDNFGCVMDPKAVAAVRAALAREREKAKP